MTDSVDRLGPHLTMLINGECFTFALPQFHDSKVIGWAPGHMGWFEQRAWSPKAIAEWDRRMDRHTRTQRRWGWVRHLEVPLWTWARVLDWDEDDKEISHRVWVRTTIARVLARKLITPAPENRGSHLVTGNRAESLTLIGAHGAILANNFITGEMTAPGLYL